MTWECDYFAYIIMLSGSTIRIKHELLEIMFLCPQSFYGLLVPNTYLPNVPLAIYAAPLERNQPVVRE